MTTLSGRVATLEAQVLNLEQQQLSYPTSDDFNSLSVTSNARYNVLSAQLGDALSKLATLEMYIVNLKISHTSLERSFTGHTGQYLSGSNPAHHGI